MDLSPFLARAPWIAEDLRQEAILCGLEGLDERATRKHLWKIVYRERLTRLLFFDPDKLVCLNTSAARRRDRRGLLTPQQKASFERAVCIQLCYMSGVDQHTLARVHGIDQARISLICSVDLHRKFDQLTRFTRRKS